MIKLLLLFTLVPLLELWILIHFGSWIGAGWTILLVAATGFFGVLLARSQGLRILYRLRDELESGAMPAGQILDGVCILLGGAFLLTPGLLTDLLGFSLLLPPTRNVLKDLARRAISRKLENGTIVVYRRY